MKPAKDVPTKTVEKKVAKRRMVIKSQLKAGNFWDDMKTVYAPNEGINLSA